MRPLPTLVAAGLIWLSASAAALAGGAAVPAQPQPDPARLVPGLAVAYAYPGEVRTLHNARSWLKRGAEAGPPLAGLSYRDSAGPALTSKRAERVAAAISGYLRFDKAGNYRLEFHSNDGIEAEIGGARVYRDDARHPCSTRGAVSVTVPQPGWYPISLTYFQRLNTSCLLLLWQPPGGAMEQVPGSSFAHLPG